MRHIFSRSGDSQHSVSSKFGGNLLRIDAGGKSEPLLKLSGDVGLPGWSLVLLFRGDDQNISFGLDMQILIKAMSVKSRWRKSLKRSCLVFDSTGLINDFDLVFFWSLYGDAIVEYRGYNDVEF